MSAETWGKVPAWILDVEIGKPALRLFICMSAHADGDGRLCFASQDTMAEELGWKTRSGPPNSRRVRRELKSLIELDLITPAGRHIWSEGAWTKQYLVAPFPPCDRYKEYRSTNRIDRYVVDRSREAAASTTGTSRSTRPVLQGSPTGIGSTANQTLESDHSSDPLLRKSQNRDLTRDRETNDRSEDEKRALAHGPEFDAVLNEEQVADA